MRCPGLCGRVADKIWPPWFPACAGAGGWTPADVSPVTGWTALPTYGSMEGVLHQGAATLAARRGLDDLGHLLHLSCAAARLVPYRPPTWCALSRAAPPVGDVASGYSLLYATRWGTRQAAVGGAHLLLRGGICRGADGTNAVLPPATWRHRLCCRFVMVGIGLPVGRLRLLLCQVWAAALSWLRNLLPRTVVFCL